MSGETQQRSSPASSVLFSDEEDNNTFNPGIKHPETPSSQVSGRTCSLDEIMGWDFHEASQEEDTLNVFGKEPVRESASHHSHHYATPEIDPTSQTDTRPGVFDFSSHLGLSDGEAEDGSEGKEPAPVFDREDSQHVFPSDGTNRTEAMDDVDTQGLTSANGTEGQSEMQVIEKDQSVESEEKNEEEIGDNARCTVPYDRSKNSSKVGSESEVLSSLFGEDDEDDDFLSTAVRSSAPSSPPENLTTLKTDKSGMVSRNDTLNIIRRLDKLEIDSAPSEEEQEKRNKGPETFPGRGASRYVPPPGSTFDIPAKDEQEEVSGGTPRENPVGCDLVKNSREKSELFRGSTNSVEPPADSGNTSSSAERGTPSLANKYPSFSRSLLGNSSPLPTRPPSSPASLPLTASSTRAQDLSAEIQRFRRRRLAYRPVAVSLGRNVVYTLGPMRSAKSIAGCNTLRHSPPIAWKLTTVPELKAISASDPAITKVMELRKGDLSDISDREKAWDRCRDILETCFSSQPRELFASDISVEKAGLNAALLPTFSCKCEYANENGTSLTPDASGFIGLIREQLPDDASKMIFDSLIGLRDRDDIRGRNLKIFIDLSYLPYILISRKKTLIRTFLENSSRFMPFFALFWRLGLVSFDDYKAHFFNNIFRAAVAKKLGCSFDIKEILPECSSESKGWGFSSVVSFGLSRILEIPEEAPKSSLLQAAIPTAKSGSRGDSRNSNGDDLQNESIRGVKEFAEDGGRSCETRYTRNSNGTEGQGIRLEMSKKRIMEGDSGTEGDGKKEKRESSGCGENEHEAAEGAACNEEEASSEKGVDSSYKRNFSKSFADIFTLGIKKSDSETAIDPSSFVEGIGEDDRPLMPEKQGSSSSIFGFLGGVFKKRASKPQASEAVFQQRPLRADIKIPEREKERIVVKSAYANKKSPSIVIPGVSRDIVQPSSICGTESDISIGSNNKDQ